MKFLYITKNQVFNENVKLRYQLNDNIVIIIWQDEIITKYYYDEQKLIYKTLYNAKTYYEEFKLWIDEALS
jgi:hypothetical protein